MTEPKINLALAGYANVGKSVIFNHLTGLHQHIGNWPGKTVERAEGTLHYNGYTIDVLDLPGIYSLSSYSIEETITRDYIIFETPDFIVSVVDATNLETNLILFLQLLELEKPVVLALNMIDLAHKKGLKIDYDHIAKSLQIPVVPVTATTGMGIAEILDQGIALTIQLPLVKPNLQYGQEVEERITRIVKELNHKNYAYPKRFIAIKLLEKDEQVTSVVLDQDPEVINLATTLISELEQIHGHDASVVIADERSILASRIAKESVIFDRKKTDKTKEFLENITAHKIIGYPIMLFILGMIFLIVFKGGGYLAELLHQIFLGTQGYYQELFGQSWIAKIFWGGLASFFALVEIAFPYILPFYFLLFILEDCGYLARIAYLMDHFMHKMGIHGKACMPLVLGFGCNVPACLGCRIMETERERFITGLIAVFMPCSAVTVVVAGLVGRFLGAGTAVILYLALFILIFIIGKIASILAPGEPTELIMRMPSYKTPNFKTILMQTWIRLREFIYIAAPIVIISGILIEGALSTTFFGTINNFFALVTVAWLRLPAITGVLLIFGILRKELILVMLATLVGTTDFALVLTKSQIITLAIVSMLYIPCAATIAALYHEFGWKKALAITILKIALAILIAGAVVRVINF